MTDTQVFAVQLFDGGFLAERNSANHDKSVPLAYARLYRDEKYAKRAATKLGGEVQEVVVLLAGECEPVFATEHNEVIPTEVWDASHAQPEEQAETTYLRAGTLGVAEPTGEPEGQLNSTLAGLVSAGLGKGFAKMLKALAEED